MLAGFVLSHDANVLYGGDLRVEAEEGGLTRPTGDALRPLLDMVERSVGRDAGWDYGVPVAGISIWPLLEQ